MIVSASSGVSLLGDILGNESTLESVERFCSILKGFCWMY